MDDLEVRFRQAVDDGDAQAIATLGEQVDNANALLTAALFYASVGWPVFPCMAGEKRPRNKHGFKDATTDAAAIGQWWDWHPYDNIGLPTGLAFDVIDIDGSLGWESIRASDMEFPPRIGNVATPRRPGMHWYIAPSGAGNRAGVLPGVDYRGAGGYVLAPPSRTADGSYHWVGLGAPWPGPTA